MRIINLSLLRLIFQLIVFSCVLFTGLPLYSNENICINGFTDLSDLIPVQMKPLSLNGDWEFYKNQLVPPELFVNGTAPAPDGLIRIPGSWRSETTALPANYWTGYFTFHLKVKVRNPKKIYSIQTRYIGTAYRIFLNEEDLGGDGVVSIDAKSHKAGYKIQLVSFQPDSEYFHITLYTCNYYESIWGYTRPIQFGKESDIRMATFADYSYDLLISGILLVMAVLFILRFFQIRATGFLYLSLVIVSVLTKNLFEEGKLIPYFFTIPPPVTHKILYFSYITIVVMLLFFFSDFFRVYIHRTLEYILKFAGIGLMLFSLIFQISFRFHILLIYHLYTLVCILFYYWIMIKAVRQRDRGGIPILIGFSILTLSTLIDIINTFGIINIKYQAPTGMAFFAVFQYFYTRLINRKNQQVRILQTENETAEPENTVFNPERESMIEVYFKHLKLSQRETEIARFLMQGKNNQEIGDTIFVSINTVKFHIKNIYLKAEVQNRIEILHKYLLFKENVNKKSYPSG